MNTLQIFDLTLEHDLAPPLAPPLNTQVDLVKLNIIHLNFLRNSDPFIPTVNLLLALEGRAFN